MRVRGVAACRTGSGADRALPSHRSNGFDSRGPVNSGDGAVAIRVRPLRDVSQDMTNILVGKAAPDHVPCG